MRISGRFTTWHTHKWLIKKQIDKPLLWAYEKQLYTGNGLSINTIIEMLKANEIDGELIGKRPKKIRAALKAGKPMIAYMGSGIFTNNGHCVVIAGINKANQVLVIDPNSEGLSNKWYLLERIFAELGSTTGIIVCENPVI